MAELFLVCCCFDNAIPMRGRKRFMRCDFMFVCVCVFSDGFFILCGHVRVRTYFTAQAREIHAIYEFQTLFRFLLSMLVSTFLCLWLTHSRL